MSVIGNILNPRPEKDGDFFVLLQDLLGFKPKKKEIYERAFTHRSKQEVDSNGNPVNYERLEFLGDAMLGAVISSYL